MVSWLILHPTIIANGLRSGDLRELTDEEKAREPDAVAWSVEFHAFVFATRSLCAPPPMLALAAAADKVLDG